MLFLARSPLGGTELRELRIANCYIYAIQQFSNSILADDSRERYSDLILILGLVLVRLRSTVRRDTAAPNGFANREQHFPCSTARCNSRNSRPQRSLYATLYNCATRNQEMRRWRKVLPNRR